MSDYIALDECIDRHTYYVRSRNLVLGVFREESGGFIGIREKFGELFLFEEFHRDKGAPFGTVTPIWDTGHELPADIEATCGWMGDDQWIENGGLSTWLSLADTVAHYLVTHPPQ